MTFTLRWENFPFPSGYGYDFIRDGGPDLDLNVVDPAGNLKNRFSIGNFEANPGMTDDDIGLYGSGTATGTILGGPEIVFYRSEPESGTYTYFVTLFNKGGFDMPYYREYLTSAYDYIFYAYDTSLGLTGSDNLRTAYTGCQYVVEVRPGHEATLVRSSTGSFDLVGNASQLVIPGTNLDASFTDYGNMPGDTGNLFYVSI